MYHYEYSDIPTCIPNNYYGILKDIHALCCACHFRGKDAAQAQDLAYWTSWHKSDDDKCFLRVRLPVGDEIYDKSPFDEIYKCNIVGMYYKFVKKHLAAFAARYHVCTKNTVGNSGVFRTVLPPPNLSERGWDCLNVGEWQIVRDWLKFYTESNGVLSCYPNEFIDHIEAVL